MGALSKRRVNSAALESACRLKAKERIPPSKVRKARSVAVDFSHVGITMKTGLEVHWASELK